jgi:DNA repair exonuclease SbcCD ATPase subunit
MFSFGGEYSHPYIDQEIHRPGMKSQVQALIDAEKAAIPKVPDEASQIDLSPPSHPLELPELSPEATYEMLAHSELVLRDLLIHGPSKWRGGIRELERLLEAANLQKKVINEEIDEITRARRDEQEAAAQRIQKLQSVAADLKTRTQKVQEAISELNKS